MNSKDQIFHYEGVTVVMPGGVYKQDIQDALDAGIRAGIQIGLRMMEEEKMKLNLFSIHQVADTMIVGKDTVYKWVRDGKHSSGLKMPFFHNGTKTVISEYDFKRFLEKLQAIQEG